MPDVGSPTIPTYLFDQNWRLSPSLVSRFETQIDRDLDASEQRRSMRSRPLRTLNLSGMTLAKEDAARFLVQQRDQTGTRHYYPLYMDESLLLSDAITGAGVVTCDTDDRRFFVGSDILIVSWGVSKLDIKVEKHTISQVLSGSLDIVGTIASTFTAGASIYPAIIADVSLSQTGNVENDSVSSFSAKLNEYTDSNTLPPLTTPNTIPAGASQYKGLPILDIPHNWQTTSEGVSRRGKTTEIGLGSVSTLYGDESRYTGQLSFRQTTRAEAFDLLRFFDSRGGAAFPFWYPLKSRALILESKTAATITVESNLGLGELTGENKILSIWLKDGTVYIRFVVGGLTIGPSHRLTLNENVTEPIEDIERISFATLARFSRDSITEIWKSSKVMDATVAIQGLPFSGDISCTGNCCEGGGCQCNPGDCDDPDDPITDDDSGDDWEPGDTCLTGTASIPMYYDLGRTWNSGREPIRAADLDIPDEFIVSIKDTMTVDASHPDAPSDLSPELKDVLFRPHLLEYAGVLERTAGKSRNPYHYRVSGTSPSEIYSFKSGGELVEDSPYWEEVIAYKINEGEPEEEDHTLTIRSYAEWVDQTAAGGDSEFGAWGALWVTWAWSSEHDDYVDGTPYAGFDNISFTKLDPIVGGAYAGEATANKYAHPSALFMSMCPTTWHVPLGYDFHSMLDRNQFLHECFQELPGAPWSNGSATDASNNAVFGSNTGGSKRRALGLLGGWTTSEFFNWVCIENTQGTGRTLLEPARPGWVEATGILTPGSADITIKVCTPPQTAINPCEGHPSDPLEGIGGTHECWRDNSVVGVATSWLCQNLTAPTTVQAFEKCLTTTSEYDSNCDETVLDCFETTVVSIFDNLRVEDYTYTFGGSPAGRTLTFKQYENNPDYVRQDWPQIECDAPGTYWDSDIGTGALTLTGCPSSPSGDIICTPTSGKTVNLLVSFDPPLGQVEDGTVIAKVTLSAGDRVGLAWRTDFSGGNITEGYLGIVDEPNQKIILYLVDGSDSISLLGEVSVDVPTGVELTIAATSLGSTQSFSVVDLGTVSLDDCTYQSGNDPALVSLSISVFTLSEISVIDNNWQKLAAIGTMSATALVSSSVDSRICRGYLEGTCIDCIPADCPGDVPFGPGCNGPCTSVCKAIEGLYEVLSSEYPSDGTEPHNVPGGWHPPTDVGPCDTVDCETCPGPYKGYSWFFSGNCGTSVDPAANLSIWLGGLSNWTWAGAV